MTLNNYTLFNNYYVSEQNILLDIFSGLFKNTALWNSENKLYSTSISVLGSGIYNYYYKYTLTTANGW